MKVLIFKCGHCFGQFSSQVPDFLAWHSCVMRVMLQFDPSRILCSHPPRGGLGTHWLHCILSPLRAEQVPLFSACGCCYSHAALVWAAAFGWCWDVHWANRAAAPCSEQPCCGGTLPQQIRCFKWFIQRMGGTKMTFHYFNISEWIFNK